MLSKSNTLPSIRLDSAEKSGVEAAAEVVAAPQPTEESLQTAARLKVLLGPSGRMSVVSGLNATDGTTALVAQLGASLASIDPSRVLIVDGNSRAPNLHTALGIRSQPGLLDVFDQRSTLENAIQPTSTGNLFVLRLGESQTPLSLSLNSPAAAAVFAEMRAAFRYVLIDAGIALARPENIFLSSISDGVVLAINKGSHRQHEVTRFQQELGGLNLRLIGVVITRRSRV